MYKETCRWETVRHIGQGQAWHIGREPSHSIRHAAFRLTNTIHIVQAKKEEISPGPGELASLKPGTGFAHLHQVGLDSLLSRIASHFALPARALAPESAGLGKCYPGMQSSWQPSLRSLRQLLAGAGAPRPTSNLPVLGMRGARIPSCQQYPPVVTAAAAAAHSIILPLLSLTGTVLF